MADHLTVGENHPDDTVNHHDNKEEFPNATARDRLGHMDHPYAHEAKHHDDAKENPLGTMENVHHGTEVDPLSDAAMDHAQFPPDCWLYG